ncbi:predicted protein [Uncinocarpus reesii 1704]|uniref:Uncharacterized protein n=1 Tax=Uncinocarpus reesii (strain UAMH 1704) TaxID=336963 RepID=C4JQC4_UNCRE|nr:uncharacterized protein UREG_04678 [Uncinocarpus reesii 1704]EEP79832.1 predicted protein [Uncinocarpus reesii 1704]
MALEHNEPSKRTDIRFPPGNSKCPLKSSMHLMVPCPKSGKSWIVAKVHARSRDDGEGWKQTRIDTTPSRSSMPHSSGHGRGPVWTVFYSGIDLHPTERTRPPHFFFRIRCSASLFAGPPPQGSRSAKLLNVFALVQIAIVWRERLTSQEVEWKVASITGARGLAGPMRSELARASPQMLSRYFTAMPKGARLSSCKRMQPSAPKRRSARCRI